MDQDAQKRSAAQAALAYIEPRLTPKTIVGVGTGSTTNFFIDALAEVRHKFDACVSSSEASTERLKGHGVQVLGAPVQSVLDTEDRERFIATWSRADLTLYKPFNDVYRTYFKDHFPARAFLGSGPLLANGNFEVTGIAVKQ